MDRVMERLHEYGSQELVAIASVVVAIIAACMCFALYLSGQKEYKKITVKFDIFIENTSHELANFAEKNLGKTDR